MEHVGLTWMRERAHAAKAYGSILFYRTCHSPCGGSSQLDIVDEEHLFDSCPHQHEMTSFRMRGML
jgi:hypothetical protein